jgi:hypothetical protein
MKKFLIPLVAGVAVFGSVTAFAATMNVTSNGLGAGDAAVAACDDNAAVSYVTGLDATTHQYAVTSVTVTTTGAGDCGGMAFKVSLLNASNALLGSEITGTLDSSGAKTVGSLNVSAASLSHVAVVVTG